MKKFLSVLVCILIVFSSGNAFAINEAPTFNLWKRKHTYNDLVYRVGKQVQKCNDIKTHYVFEAKGRGIPYALTDTRDVVIYIYSKLMKGMSSDDELASVMAFKIAQKELGQGTVLRELGKKCVFPFYAYITRQELRRADLKAVDYMVKAGYDPFAMLVVKDRFLREPDRWKITMFFYTYSSAKDRIKRIGDYIMQNYPEKKNGYFATKFRQESTYANLINWDGYTNVEDTSNPKLMEEVETNYL